MRDSKPPVASVMMDSALATLPNKCSSSIRIPVAFEPPTVLSSAATTFSVARVTRLVMVRVCGWMW